MSYGKLAKTHPLRFLKKNHRLVKKDMMYLKPNRLCFSLVKVDSEGLFRPEAKNSPIDLNETGHSFCSHQTFQRKKGANVGPLTTQKDKLW